jgi:hypothetical protein
MITLNGVKGYRGVSLSAAHAPVRPTTQKLKSASRKTLRFPAVAGPKNPPASDCDFPKNIDARTRIRDRFIERLAHVRRIDRIHNAFVLVVAREHAQEKELLFEIGPPTLPLKLYE